MQGGLEAAELQVSLDAAMHQCTQRHAFQRLGPFHPEEQMGASHCRYSAEEAPCASICKSAELYIHGGMCAMLRIRGPS